MRYLIAAATDIVVLFGLLLWFHRRSQRRWSKGLTVVCVGIVVSALAVFIFRSVAISLPLLILSMVLIWGGGLMHNPFLRDAIRHGDPPDVADN